MKRTVLAITLSLVIGLGTGFQASEIQDGNLEQYQSVINEKTDEAPPFLSGLVGNQTVNLNINNEDGTDITAGIKIQGLVITEMQAQKYDNATIKITTNQKTVENIADSTNPVGTAFSEFNEGDIRYEAEGFWNKLKLSIAEAFI